MGFKKMENNFSFDDISLFSSLERNRAVKRMQQINAIVDWSRIETLLMRNYPVGKSAEGNEAYPPLILSHEPSLPPAAKLPAAVWNGFLLSSMID